MHRIIILFTGFLAYAAFFTSPLLAQKSQAEYGKCGYYADALQGRKTASGEKYDKNLLTCAHKTLPFGTQIKVTRLDNGKSVVVRVNDRGPYIEGYITDISRKAAETIGLIRDGVTRVKIQVVNSATTARAVATSTTKVLPKELEPVPLATTAKAKAQLLTTQKSGAVAPVTYSATTLAQPDPILLTKAASESELFLLSIRPVNKAGFGLQVSALTNTEKLFQEVSKLQIAWPGKVMVNHEEFKDIGTASFKLIIGPYATRKEAEAQQRKAASQGYKSSFVVDLSQ